MGENRFYVVIEFGVRVLMVLIAILLVGMTVNPVMASMTTDLGLLTLDSGETFIVLLVIVMELIDYNKKITKKNKR